VQEAYPDHRALSNDTVVHLKPATVAEQMHTIVVPPAGIHHWGFAYQCAQMPIVGVTVVKSLTVDVTGCSTSFKLIYSFYEYWSEAFGHSASQYKCKARSESIVCDTLDTSMLWQWLSKLM
jgi:hypothetical protein